ncbi:CCN family member 1-like isoform X2 [Nothobranchius furzeri]|uniref:CCN family member 1-like isoform X2 n=1 Tax=Nothobranchius furzeri TaxID=105023 RepID=UPI003904CCF3
MGFLLYLTLLTAAVITQVTASCPVLCGCPTEPAVCPPGVSTVPDRCGCCKVCAAQLNQDCSHMRPCDHHKGLECNYGNDITVTQGVCRAKQDGRSCEYNSRIYQNGESFQAGCKHQCTCIDGAVGCTSVCSSKLPPASPACPYPRLVRTPGQCCFRVDCNKDAWLPSNNRMPSLQQQLIRQKHLFMPKQPEKERVLANVLPDLSSSRWEGENGFKHLPEKCPILTTKWSQCSRSCGTGISSRLTNKNARCELEKETRICTVRPCHGPAVPGKRGKTCSSTWKAPEPLRLTYGECWSVRLYQPSYCGRCTDERCCLPQRTRTAPVAFVCPDGERLQRLAMFIQVCRCSDDCNHLNDVALPPQHWMLGDIK